MEKRFAPATERNREPILEVLREVLPTTGLVLEVASGTGQHAMFFAQAFPGLRWQPSDPDPASRESISAWAEDLEPALRKTPLDLNAATWPWPLTSADAVVCINMIHISPWQSTLGLLDGASRVLQDGGPLVLYGPFRRRGKELEPSNEAFDASLRAKDLSWGIRELEQIQEEALQRGLVVERVVDMPARNLTVVLRKVTT